ncbi:MAG: tetratricopeptide repeat protein [Cyclobacteriaceae bacterium]
MKKLLQLVAIFFVISSLRAQGPLDSVTYYSGKAKANEFISFDSMYFYANKILAIGLGSNDQLAIGKYHSIVGVALQETGFYDSAIFHQNQAMKIGKSLGDSVLISAAYQHLGVINKELSNYTAALENLLNAIRISDQIGQYYTSAMANLVISQIQFGLGKYEDAFKYVDECIAIGRANDDSFVISAGMTERGNSKTMTGDLDGAIEDFREVERVQRRSGKRDGLASIMSNIGAVYFYKGDLRKAIDNYQLAKEEAEISEDPVMIGVAIQNMGEAYIYLKQFDKAAEMLTESLELFVKQGNKRMIIANYQYLHDLEQARKDYQAALNYFVLKDMYEDSVLNENNFAKISNLQIAYETEKKEQSIKTLQVEAALNALEISQKRNQIIGLAISAILLLIGVTLYSSRKRYKLRAQLAEEKEQLQKGRFKAVIDAEEKERKRIAQELHDGLGQLLSTARINVSGVGDKEDKKVRNSLSLIDQSIEEVRSISHNLMPNALISVGLKSALDELVRKINMSDQITTEFSVIGDLYFNEVKTIGVYRVIQEVINNALKYSQSETLELKIENKGIATEIVISDHGDGFDLALIDNSTGIGWSNIYSRVDLMNGKINIYSKLKEGTTVKITIPNDKESDQAAVG